MLDLSIVNYAVIDNSSDAITSNITNVIIRRDLRIALNSFVEYEICFGNCIIVQSCDGYNIKSSGFNVDGIAGTVYLTDKPDPHSTNGTDYVNTINIIYSI